jgi:hypothetical protein
MKTKFLIALLLLTASFANPQKSEDFRRVSGKDVLDQLDAAILMNELQKRPTEDTVLLVKQIIALNKIQLQDAENRQYDSQHPGQKSPLGGLGDLKKPFYDLRGQICKSFSGVLVDLDGQLKPGCDQSGK